MGSRMTMSERKHVIVAVGQEVYGIPILDVETILNDPKPVRIPKTPKMMLGLFELRGKTMAAVDLRIRLDMPETNGENRHVVVNTASGPVSLRVDSVEGIVNIEESKVSPPNTLIDNSDDPFISGVAQCEDRLVAVLDVNHIVPDSLKKKIKAAS